SFDITDLLTNTTGALVGGAVYLLIGKIVRDKSKRDKLINVLATVMLSATMVLAALLIVANS
ncbi:MAG: VanZ family protein, partial [Clostridia bacterium]|nr:VanZ family protein [Clostridia bacterium]